MTDFSRDIPPRFSAQETEYGVQVAARRDLADQKTYWRITQVFLGHSGRDNRFGIVRNPIDRFILARLEKEKIVRNSIKIDSVYI